MKTRQEKTTDFLFLLFIAAVIASIVICFHYNHKEAKKLEIIEEKQRNYNFINKNNLVIDLPEETPITGDVLIVLSQRNDTLFMGYYTPNK